MVRQSDVNFNLLALPCSRIPLVRVGFITYLAVGHWAQVNVVSVLNRRLLNDPIVPTLQRTC
jgi:hypothetical protein